MKVSKRNLLISLVCITVLVGSFSCNKLVQAKEGITITDSTGRTVTLNQSIERVVILNRSAAEIMRALGVEDKIVGIHKSMKENPYWPEMQDKPVVASYSEINYEKIAEVKPQLVISSTRAHGVVGGQEKLDHFNIKDIKFSLRRPEIMKKEVLKLGKIFDRQERARELVNFYRKYEQLIGRKLKGVKRSQKPRIFVEYHAGNYRTGGKGSRFYHQTRLAGAVNIAESLHGDREVSAEWIWEKNPDIILREHSSVLGYGITSTEMAQEARKEIMSRPGLKQTNAIKNDDVYILSLDIYSRPRYIVGTCYLAKWLYPEKFINLEPAKVHREYLEKFQTGIDYKGSWAYPLPEDES